MNKELTKNPTMRVLCNGKTSAFQDEVHHLKISSFSKKNETNQRNEKNDTKTNNRKSPRFISSQLYN